MALPQLLGPDPREGLVGRLGGGVDGLARHPQPRGGRGDEDDATSGGKVRQGGLGEEDCALNVGVEVAGVEGLGYVFEVGVDAEGGAGKRLAYVYTHI